MRLDLGLRITANSAIVLIGDARPKPCRHGVSQQARPVRCRTRAPFALSISSPISPETHVAAKAQDLIKAVGHLQ